ncbi:MAG: DUF6160 family protein [Marinobacter sp.]|uniref:DUF6160 family protein n=1 Tax=Marinobacter sp. TaxID=50741 RepID=UPI00299E2320|nr:DUF6160 family protein [Marinobacter sp.]MDX1634676.1 DUF6160 family protein [Marinobacter sp.]
MHRLSRGSALTLTLASSLALTAQAEIRALPDAAMGEITGQAGVTIELETKVDVGRFAWTDQGTLSVNDLSLSGLGGGPLDNLKVSLDVAGENEVLEHGFSEIARRAGNGRLDPGSNPDIADALTRYAVAGDYGKAFNSGDLVIHIGPTDSGDPGQLNDYLRAVDFQLDIGSVVTEGADGATTLFSDIHLEGYLGPTDIVVRNHGSDTRLLANGNEVSDSELQVDTHFEITNGRLNWDVADVILLFNFAAVSIDGLQIHNRRGADTLGHFGMAHATAKLSAGTSATSGKDGLSVHDVEFRADIDMPVFRMGGTAIGAVSFTDFAITNTSMMIYGH